MLIYSSVSVITRYRKRGSDELLGFRPLVHFFGKLDRLTINSTKINITKMSKEIMQFAKQAIDTSFEDAREKVDSVRNNSVNKVKDEILHAKQVLHEAFQGKLQEIDTLSSSMVKHEKRLSTVKSELGKMDMNPGTKYQSLLSDLSRDFDQLHKELANEVSMQ